LNGSSVGVRLVNGATAWTAQSDETLKTIIEPIIGATEKVSEIRSVIYRFTGESEDTRRVGLIAQDVLAVLPEAVSEDEDGILGVRYTEVIPLLVAALNEQNSKVLDLETRLANLENN
jgi:hypothetical protein